MKPQDIGLKEYINFRFKILEKETENARSSMDKRLDGMNEFRDQLKDQAGRFITREEYEAKYEALVEKIDGIQKPIWIGIGVILTLEFLLKFFIK